MSMMVSFVLSFFPRDVLDEILNLIESVSEDFPSYSFNYIPPKNQNRRAALGRPAIKLLGGFKAALLFCSLVVSDVVFRYLSVFL